MNNKFAIIADENGRDRVSFSRDLTFCSGLQMCPRELEPDVHFGLWLVLVYAVWSKPDLDSIATAVRASERFIGKVRLGVRPFNLHEEISSWCPQVTERSGSPVWLIFRGGKLMEQSIGIRNDEELVAMIERHISPSN